HAQATRPLEDASCLSFDSAGNCPLGCLFEGLRDLQAFCEQELIQGGHRVSCANLATGNAESRLLKSESGGTTSWGESITGSAISFSASPSANPVGLRRSPTCLKTSDFRA